jgi:hypothetical protein
MDFSWSLTILAIVWNSSMMLSMFLAQQFEVKRGTTPSKGTSLRGTDRLFHHWQQFHCMTWGDFFGIGALDVVVLHMVDAGTFQAWQIVVASPLVMLGCMWFAYACTRPNHADDYGFIGNKTTLAGIGHMCYCMIQYTAGIMLLLAALSGDLTLWPIATAVGGLIVWGVSMLTDILHRHFDSLDDYLY